MKFTWQEIMSEGLFWGSLRGGLSAKIVTVYKSCIDENPEKTREEQGDKRLLELGFGTVYSTIRELLSDVEEPDPYDWDEEEAGHSSSNEYVGRWKGAPIHVVETHASLYDKGNICEKETFTGILTIRRIDEDEYRRIVNEYLGIPDDDDDEW